ncbi:hypothetical protein A2153_05900 [Candidatus Gottesmanbacteria bacterium RBG_16_38_7b]|nr:MAG: hypothetical protein A2153_05900 [Candidatus Gottesmanbacteria bacterium RBG_16_38_7b]
MTFQQDLNDEETWVRLTQNYLNSTPRGTIFHTINAGIGDIGTKEEIDNLEMTVNQVQPDLVILGWYLNDSRPPWGFSQEMEYRGFLRRYSVLADVIYRQLVLKKWLTKKGLIRTGWGSGVKKYNWKTDRQEFLKFTDYAGLDWGVAWKNESWNTIRNEFKRLKALSQKYQFKVLIVAFPVIYQIHAEFVEDAPQRKLEDISKDYQFYYMDLLPILRKEETKQHLFFDYVHLNEIGSKIVADYLSQNLQNIISQL